MIQEAYCSFEVAKLLKEKGFNEPCYRWYNAKGDVCAKFINPDIPLDYSSREYYLCPSQSMTMKWLREVHHLYINVGFGNDYKGEFLYMGDIYDLTKDAIHAKYEPIIEADDYLSNNPKTYEEACEAAIKYCLENLIE